MRMSVAVTHLNSFLDGGQRGLAVQRGLRGTARERRYGGGRRGADRPGGSGGSSRGRSRQVAGRLRAARLHRYDATASTAAVLHLVELVKALRTAAHVLDAGRQRTRREQLHVLGDDRRQHTLHAAQNEARSSAAAPTRRDDRPAAARLVLAPRRPPRCLAAPAVCRLAAAARTTPSGVASGALRRLATPSPSRPSPRSAWLARLAYKELSNACPLEMRLQKCLHYQESLAAGIRSRTENQSEVVRRSRNGRRRAPDAVSGTSSVPLPDEVLTNCEKAGKVSLTSIEVSRRAWGPMLMGI